MKDQEFIVQKIRTQYTEKQHTELDELKALDAKVKKPANVFAYSYGAVGAVVMGAGMSLVMTDIGAMIGLSATMAPGIAVGVVGLGMALTTYPIYKKIETGAVEGFGKVVDKCVEILFTKEGESIEDAKKRLSHKEEK